MQIKKFSIDGLFDLFDHVIPFKTKERVTIIHGPNGVGKTTVLKLLADLFGKKFNSLRVIPYKRLRLEFTKPKSILEVDRLLPKNKKDPIQLKFLFRTSNKKFEHTTKPVRDYREISRHLPLHLVEEVIGPLERVGSQRWIDHSTGEMLDIDEVLMAYSDQLPFDFPSIFMPAPDWLKKTIDALPIHFIQTQRLFALPSGPHYERKQRSTKSTATVERYSEEMVDRIRESLRQSAVLAASLDRTFPHRLLESEPPRDVTENMIRSQYEKQEEYRGRLMAAGLIDPEDPVALSPDPLDTNDLRVLWHYLNDVEKKFEIFDSLLKRVELFKDIINTRFLYKNFSVDKENGFILKTEKGNTVPLRTLSSGEQHELVLAFELLFRVKEGSMILIDEPELSLHVTWQHKFLEDIGRISDLANLDFLVATHSPSIIHKQSRLMVPLGEHQ